MEFFNKIKEWFASIRKLTAAIFLSILGVLLVVTVYGYAVDFYKSQKNQKYEKIQDWNYDLSMIGIKVSARTKLVDDNLYFSVKMDGYPEYLNAPANRGRDFIFQFRDADNFVIFEKRVALSDFATQVDEKSKPIGLNYQTTQFMNTSTYEKFKLFYVQWTFDATTKKQNPAPVAINPKGEQADHCAAGLSRAERLRRLALTGTVRETSYQTYSNGKHFVEFLSSGSDILNCR